MDENLLRRSSDPKYDEDLVNLRYLKNFSYIVETGSNSNGEWIRFADGTQICMKTVTGTVAMTTAWGHMYSGQLNLGDWPIAFIDVPKISTTNISSTGAIITDMEIPPSSTNVGTVYLCRPSVSTSTVIIQVVGIGKWK